MRAPATLLLLAACAAHPSATPVAAPAVVVRYSAAPVDATARPPQTLEVVAWHGSWDGGEAADSRAVAMVAVQGAPFRTAAKSLIGLRIGRGSPTPATPTARTTALLGDDLSTAITWSSGELPRLVLRRVGDAVHIALRDDAAGTTVDLGAQPIAADGNLCFAASPRGGLPGTVLVLRIAGEAPARGVTTVRAGLAVELADAAPRPSRVSWPDILPGVAVGEAPRRRALLACVSLHGIPRLFDFVLAADEPMLIALAEALPARPADAFAVERAAFGALLPALQRGQANPAMAAAMRRHFGALATDATTVEFLLADATDAAAFAAAVRRANLDALDDRTPGRRVDAAAWLAARGVDLAGYDPLAPRDARRRIARHLAEVAR